jgi:hypothetical protein
MQPTYTIHSVREIDMASVSAPQWARAECVDIAHYRPESSAHHPRVQARLLWSAQGIHGLFHVQDQYVRAVRTHFQGEVWKDSCVEFFVQPKPDCGYFNFEMNCGGTLLCSHVTDPTRVPTGLKQATSLPKELGEQVRIQSTLPKVVNPEITTLCQWSLAFFIPFAIFEPYVGSLGLVATQHWRGNFYKCAEDISHPHWGAWAPVNELNFHLPRCFGELVFAAS